MEFNKEIYSLKLSINTSCTLRCKYCFVNKTQEKMDWNTARNAIDLSLNSPGTKKIIKIYGGEPLLNFEMVEKIVSYAKTKAGKLNKSLIVSPCTNLTLLTEKQALFFKREDLSLAISTDGDEKSHNSNRIFKNGKGSFSAMDKNLPLILRNLPKKRFAANLGVTPNLARRMSSNFIYLIHRGFDTVNLEPIQEVHWSAEEEKAFERSMNQITEYLVEGIKNKNFAFLAPVNRELKHRELSNLQHRCLFYLSMEVYPQGDVAFSPFLMNSARTKECVAGNVNRKLLEKYRGCVYAVGDDRHCMHCREEYYKRSPADHSSAKILSLRNSISVKTARHLEKLAESDSRYEKYIQEAREHICF